MGNETCVQCGACCYDYNFYSLCRNQEIRDGKSYCRMHESPQRDLLCQNWFCDSSSDSQLIEIAIELGTAPSNYPSSTIPIPQ